MSRSKNKENNFVTWDLEINSGPMHATMMTSNDVPDMNGAVIIANQALMILDKPPTDLPE
ncbi:MAG: hypothetical protein RLO17_00735 [Cyclobacteriaceae bacterium]